MCTSLCIVISIVDLNIDLHGYWLISISSNLFDRIRTCGLLVELKACDAVRSIADAPTSATTSAFAPITVVALVPLDHLGTTAHKGEIPCWLLVTDPTAVVPSHVEICVVPVIFIVGAKLRLRGVHAVWRQRLVSSTIELLKLRHNGLLT